MTAFEELPVHSDLAVVSAREAWKQMGKPRHIWLCVAPCFDQNYVGRLLEYWGGTDRPRIVVHTDHTLGPHTWYLEEPRRGRRVGSSSTDR